MTVLLLVTLLATASVPQGTQDPWPAAPDTLGVLDGFGSLGSPGAAGQAPAAGFS